MLNCGATSPSPKNLLRRPKLGQGVRVLTSIVVLTWLASLAVPTSFAQGASQIVLSCTTPNPNTVNTNGCSSTEAVTTPPIINAGTLYLVGGFWVWCQAPTSGTPYGPDCNGAMYLAEVDLATGTAKYETTSVSGSSSVGVNNNLQVMFTAKDGDVTCTLSVPASPTSGPTNQLSGHCGTTNPPTVPIVFGHAVVKVT